MGFPGFDMCFQMGQTCAATARQEKLEKLGEQLATARRAAADSEEGLYTLESVYP
jgi:hypothetical protein